VLLLLARKKYKNTGFEQRRLHAIEWLEFSLERGLQMFFGGTVFPNSGIHNSHSSVMSGVLGYIIHEKKFENSHENLCIISKVWRDWSPSTWWLSLSVLPIGWTAEAYIETVQCSPTHRLNHHMYWESPVPVRPRGGAIYNPIILAPYLNRTNCDDGNSKIPKCPTPVHAVITKVSRNRFPLVRKVSLM